MIFFCAFNQLEPSVKRHIYLYVEIISNYIQIISGYVEITPRFNAGSMPSATVIATNKKRSVDKPAHAHLRRFNVINNYVNIIVNMYL